MRNTHADLQDNALALPSKRFRSKATCRTDSESDMEEFFRMMQMMKEMAKGMDEPKIDVLTTRRRSTSSSRSSEAPERLALHDLPQLLDPRHSLHLLQLQLWQLQPSQVHIWAMRLKRTRLTKVMLQLPMQIKNLSPWKTLSRKLLINFKLETNSRKPRKLTASKKEGLEKTQCFKEGPCANCFEETCCCCCCQSSCKGCPNSSGKGQLLGMFQVSRNPTWV